MARVSPPGKGVTHDAGSLEKAALLRIFACMKEILPPIGAIPLLLLICLPAGCRKSDTTPDPAAEKFQEYYAGELVEREISRLENEPPSRLDSRLDSLRGLYGFSRAQTDSLLGIVRDSLPLWEAFLNDVLEKIERREEQLSADTLHPVRKGSNGI